MVRADHEDGAVLNPDDEPGTDDTAEAETAELDGAEVDGAQVDGADAAGQTPAAAPARTPVVRKSSPLGRKPKPSTAKRTEAATDESDDDGRDADAATDDTVPVEEAAGTTGGYRDKRMATQRRRTAREAAAAAKKKPAKKAPARTAGGRSGAKLAALMSGVVVLIVGLVLSIFFAIGYQRIDRDRELRAEYATFARQVVVQMTTLDSENADNMYKLAMEKTSGRAQQVFRDNMKQVTDLIRQGDAVTTTTVLTDAVSKATEDEGTVLMVVGWESRTKDGKQEPLFQTFRYKVGLTRINGDVKVTDLEFVW